MPEPFSPAQTQTDAQVAPAPPLNPSGLPVVPDHELLRLIGEGSYGAVWLVRNLATGAWRAAKVVHRSAFDDDRPFEREFRGLLKFEPISHSHDSQVRILHVGRGEGCFYYVMELADCAEAEKEKRGKGEEESNPGAPAPPPLFPFSPLPLFSPATYTPRTLKHDLKSRGRLPPAECVEIGLALTKALGHLHAHSLVHRDIKPSNIIFVGGVPKLADIGLVTDVDASRSFVGTEGYLPPEGPGTPQADLYSLGKVLYEMSTGRDRKDYPALPLDWDALDPAEQSRLLELNEVLVKVCEADPRRRYQSAEQLRADLALLQDGKSVRRARGVERRWSRVRIVALGLSLLALVLAGVARLSREAQRHEAASNGPPSTNELANALCAKGLLILSADNRSAFAEAYTNFSRAVELDPNFARPYVGLLDLYTFEGGARFPGTASNRLHTVAARLNELAPDLGATHKARSFICWGDWDFVNALKHAQETVRRSPDYWQGHMWHGFLLTHLGWPAEARNELRMAQRIAPSKVTLHRGLGHTYYFQRDFTNAIASYEEALRWEPNHAMAYQWIGFCQQALGDIPTAITNFSKCDVLLGQNAAEIQARSANLLRAFHSGGASGYWQEQWKLVEEDDFYRKAEIQARLGDTNAAFAWLAESCRVHQRFEGDVATPLNYLLIDEVWDPLRNDPRFKAVLEKTGFSKVMPKRP